jgi:death-on-curing protein
MRQYLTAVEVRAIHADQVERFGGAAGVRDPGQLQAALFRAQTGFYTDLIEEAAALWESLAQNRSFNDGNQRTAFAATHTFLALNGARLTSDPDATYAFIESLCTANAFRFETLVHWLRLNVSHSGV